MKTLALLALAACGAAQPAHTNAARDRDAITQLGPAFDDAWQHRDPHARAQLFADDATLINPFGMRAESRADIEKVFTAETATIAHTSTHHFGAMQIQFLDADTAFVDADNLIGELPNGDLRYHLVAIAKRTPEGWRWLAGRPYSFLPPP
ncbi:MAG: SgcJ/EcaC family oxidoreductase [Deltaproteobacteria bacterium]|nr:SgcJ/EcaC family oxidoreductase [Deltaproteobacteria bacterium]